MSHLNSTHKLSMLLSAVNISHSPYQDKQQICKQVLILKPIDLILHFVTHFKTPNKSKLPFQFPSSLHLFNYHLSYPDNYYFSYPDLDIEDNNFCRNFNAGEPGGPWCYNGEGTNPRWDYCGIAYCDVAAAGSV